jgi:hypothetical protein
MPSKSQAQKFMAMVLEAKKDKKPASKEVAKASHSMSEKSAMDYAGIKRKRLPEHKKEILKTMTKMMNKKEMMEE